MCEVGTGLIVYIIERRKWLKGVEVNYVNEKQGTHDKRVAPAACSNLQSLTYLNNRFEQCTNYTSGFWFNVA